MRIGGIVQARMTSVRCPGKVLQPILGRPLLWYLLTSLTKCRTLDELVVATSQDDTDNPIEQFCIAAGIGCYRGPLTNVARRFQELVERAGWDAFVRISGDSPLLDYRLVDRIVGLFRRSPCDLATNVPERTFPRGQSVEVVRAGAFQRALGGMVTGADTEHVTPYFYRHWADFEIRNIRCEPPCGEVRMTVDEPDDLMRIELLLKSLDRPHWQLPVDELVAAYRRVSAAVGAAIQREAA